MALKMRSRWPEQENRSPRAAGWADHPAGAVRPAATKNPTGTRWSRAMRRTKQHRMTFDALEDKTLLSVVKPHAFRALATRQFAEIRAAAASNLAASQATSSGN